MEPTLDPLLGIALTLYYGFIRIMFATHASFIFGIAYHDHLRANPPTRPDIELLNDPVPFNRLSYAKYEAFGYVWDMSCIVYATSLFDTFLSEITFFLLLTHPGAIGKDHSIPLSDVLSIASRSELITHAARKQARETSFLSLAERIRYLEKTFGLRLDIEPQTTDAINRVSQLRNAAIHDQGIFDLALTDDGKVTSTQKADPRHPRPIEFDLFLPALTAYVKTFQSIVRATSVQVLNRDTDPELEHLLSTLADALSRMSGEKGDSLRPTTR